MSIASGLTATSGQVGPETSVSATNATLDVGSASNTEVDVGKSKEGISTTSKESKKSKKSNIKEDESEIDPVGKKNKKVVEKETKRELLEMRICSIQVSELIHAHRFKKNLPWIKVDYGENHWESPYEIDEQGDFADFMNLDWKFILQRDTRHRDDLIVTVCSDVGDAGIIVGRYMLGAAEFTNIPVTKSGYFKVSGQVVNALGIAGKVTIVFKKIIALPPKAPRFTEATPFTIKANLLPHDTRSYIRVVSIACADLKPLKTFELNSPHCVFTCHDWKKTTDVMVGAGMSAKWNRLPWKLVMDKFYPLLVEVKSEKELLGMVQFTLEDLRNAETDDRGFKVLLSQLTDGSNFSGRIRIVIYMVDMPTTANANTYHVDIPGLGYEAEDDHYDRGQSLEDIYSNAKPANSGLALSSDLIKGAITFCPFVMRVMEAGVFDTKQCERLKPNSLSLTAACSAWGGSTFVVKNCGSDAYWVGMSSTWRFVVEDGAKLHLNVWSRESFVGTVTLSAKQIMAYPIDPDGSTEILEIIKDEGKSTGRIRLNCVFEYLRKGENTNYDPQPEPVVYIPPRAKKLEVDQYGDVPKYELPCIAKIISISVVDLKGVYMFQKNSPRVKIVCDRKSAMTSIMKRAGKSARWVDLDWDIPINEGCILMIYCYTEDIQIGFIELEAHHIADEPLDNYGMTVISQFIRDHDGLSTGKLTIIMQLQNVPDLDVYDAIVNGVDRDPYNLKKPIKSNVVKEEVDPVLEMMATQPFFSLKDATATGAGIMLSVQIIELDVTDLDAVHYFGKKNSPMVSAACGRWADTTFPQKDAGDACYWTGLDWKFLMDDNLNVQFVVGSRKKVIGSVKCNSKQFAVARADQRGVKRVTLSMFRETHGLHHFAGRLKVTYKLGVVRESQYIKRPRALERLHVEDINTPFNAIIKRIVARGMPRVHSIGPNEPRFRMSYDDWSKTTTVSNGSESEEAEWKESDLPLEDWTVSVCDEAMSFTMSIISGSELVGIAEITAKDLMDIPRSVKMIAEVVVSILKDGKSTGRLQVFIQLQPDKQVGPVHNQEEEDAELERLANEEDKARERQQYWEAKQKLLGNDTILIQQQQMLPVIQQHHAEIDAQNQMRNKNERMMQRLQIESEMEKTRDAEMMTQHQLMVTQDLTHKYAPMPLHPAGYVPKPIPVREAPVVKVKVKRAPQIQPVSDEEFQALQIRVTKETAGFNMRVASDLVHATSMIAKKGLQDRVVATENEDGDIIIKRILPVVRSGAELEGSDDDDYSEGYDPNGVQVFNEDATVTELKSSNPTHLSSNVRILGGSNDVSLLDMQDFNDEGSVVGGNFRGGVKIVNTIKHNHDFEGNLNGELDDDVSVISTNTKEKPRSSRHHGKVTPGYEQDDLDENVKSGATRGGGSGAGSQAGQNMNAKEYKGGIITNKFDDHAVNAQGHTQSRNLAKIYSIKVTGIAVLDVPSVHLLKKNSIKVICKCTGAAGGVGGDGFALESTEPVEYTTEIMQGCGDSANWTNLEFDFPLIYSKRRQLLQIDCTSDGKQAASHEWKTDDLYQDSLIEKPGSAVRKFSDMRDGGNFKGKVKLVYVLQALS